MTHHDEAQASGHEVEQASGGGGWILFIIGLVVAAAIGWGVWPTLFYAKKPQPFSFNHIAHTEQAGMSCDECHQFREDGRFTGIPRFELCLTCHSWEKRQNEDNEAEAAFVQEFVNKDGELIKSPPWLVYSGQPDCVFFPHIAHVKKGGFSCESCHGDHGKTAVLKPVYQNRLTKYSREVYEKMKMTDCSDCHLKYGKPENNACFVCHK